MDRDSNAVINEGELRHVLECLGETLSDDEIKAMMEFCDPTGSGQISWESFSRKLLSSSHGD